MSAPSPLAAKVRDLLKVAVLVLVTFGVWVALNYPTVYVDEGPYRLGDEFTYQQGIPVRWRCDQEVSLHLNLDQEPPEGVDRQGTSAYCPADVWSDSHRGPPGTYVIVLAEWDEGKDPGAIRVQRDLVWWRAGVHLLSNR